MLNDVVSELHRNDLAIAPRQICVWSASGPVALRVDGKTIHPESQFRVLVLRLGDCDLELRVAAAWKAFWPLRNVLTIALSAAVHSVAPLESGGGPGAGVRISELTLDTRCLVGLERGCHPRVFCDTVECSLWF